MVDSIGRGQAQGMVAGAAARAVVEELGVGALVIDENRRRLGRLMGACGPYVQIRPPMGGRESDVRPENVRLAAPDEIVCAPVTVRLPS
jgi:hypothetical protein